MRSSLFNRLSHPYTHIASEGYVCIGSAADCQVFEEDGAVGSRWGRQPHFPADTLALRLMPTLKQMQTARCRLPSALKECSRLDFLMVPLAMLTALEPGDLPRSLRKLMIVNSEDQPQGGTIDWKVIGETAIDSLTIHNEFGSPECTRMLEGVEEVLPRLRYLSFDRRWNGDLAGRAVNLDVLVVEDAGSGEWLSDVRPGLKALGLIGADRTFDLAAIGHLNNLEALLLNSIKAPIDAEALAALPMLRELEVLNSKKWLHVEIIPELPLNRLISIDCGRPFRACKDQFDESRYELLDIRFS